MSNVTWEQLAEAQRDYLATVCEAGWRYSWEGKERASLVSMGLIDIYHIDTLNIDEARATAAGLEVYAQRNAAPAPPPTEPLAAVWQSTAALYERFGLKPTVNNTTMVFSEETAELLHAALLESPANTALEAADVIVTALGVCMARGVALEEVAAAIQATVAKNDAKTHETHKVNEAGKIARRVE